MGAGARTMPMTVKLAYGHEGLLVDLPESRTDLIEPVHQPGLPDERQALHHALSHPVGAPPLRQLLKPTDRVCIVFTDSTRATPNDRLIPWLLEELHPLPPGQITLLNSTGTHRANTATELAGMLTREVLQRYRVLNHDCHDTSSLVAVGTMRDGTPALLNRHLIEADLRIVTGFIEPHFFAGFSGGPKGIIPGCAGLRTVMANHRATNIGSPKATFGMTHGNPLWEELRDIARRVGLSFLLNVTLNHRRQITGVYAGDLFGAHRLGCESVHAAAMRRVEAPYAIVVSTNSGAPLDLNLYQGVKGMSAAARIVKPGGTIVMACECREGVPESSPFHRLLTSAPSPQALVERLNATAETLPEQWQVQIQAQIQTRARVLLKSCLPDATVRACHLEPCADIGSFVRDELARLGSSARVAVLPQGPLTIPYFEA